MIVNGFCKEVFEELLMEFAGGASLVWGLALREAWVNGQIR